MYAIATDIHKCKTDDCSHNFWSAVTDLDAPSAVNCKLYIQAMVDVPLPLQTNHWVSDELAAATSEHILRMYDFQQLVFCI